jgi:3-hydroxyacyl-CoA dehydrogenase
LDDLSGCDLVIEAVFENLAIKTRVCVELGKICRPGAIIASNTSTLDVDILAAATGRAKDVVGMHFFSPANVMRLLEVVRGAETAPDVLATVMALAKTIGKVAVVSGVCYGFIGNRMLESYLREADFLLMEGATPSQIDGALEGFGMAMGPCRMLDLAGVDVAAKVMKERQKTSDSSQDESYRAVCLALNDLAHFGQKSGAGYYLYDGRNAIPDETVHKLCKALGAAHNITQRSSISDQEIVERCLYPMINEGARILEEGIAYRAGDIDIVWTAGYGFPRWRGGPMHFARRVGLAEIVSRLNFYGAHSDKENEYWTPATSLLAHVAEGTTFG